MCQCAAELRSQFKCECDPTQSCSKNTHSTEKSPPDGDTHESISRPREESGKGKFHFREIILTECCRKLLFFLHLTVLQSGRGQQAPIRGRDSGHVTPEGSQNQKKWWMWAESLIYVNLRLTLWAPLYKHTDCLQCTHGCNRLLWYWRKVTNIKGSQRRQEEDSGHNLSAAAPPADKLQSLTSCSFYLTWMDTCLPPTLPQNHLIQTEHKPQSGCN